ncbi:MAG: hypothetical protein WCW87_01855 [Candidatus Paceibacterota bacterium]
MKTKWEMEKDPYVPAKDRKFMDLLNHLGYGFLGNVGKARQVIDRMEEVVITDKFKTPFEELFLLIWKLVEKKEANWGKTHVAWNTRIFNRFICGKNSIALDSCHRKIDEERVRNYLKIIKSWINNDSQNAKSVKKVHKKLYAVAA